MGLLLLRVEGAVVIVGFVVAILDILPVLGTGMVLLPWAVIAASSGNLSLGIGLVALYVVVTVVRNIAEPHLVGRQMGLSPVVTLIRDDRGGCSFWELRVCFFCRSRPLF